MISAEPFLLGLNNPSYLTISSYVRLFCSLITLVTLSEKFSVLATVQPLFYWELRSGQIMGSQFSSIKSTLQGILNLIHMLLYNRLLWKGVILGMDDDNGMIKIKYCVYSQATQWKEMRCYVWVQLQEWPLKEANFLQMCLYFQSSIWKG